MMRLDDDCPQTDAVIDAYTRDRLVAEATLSDHVGRCEACAGAVADLMVRGSPGLLGLLDGLDVPSDELAVTDGVDQALGANVASGLLGPALSENEAALFAADGFTSPIERAALSVRDRHRLDRLMDGMEAARAAPPALHVVGEAPALPRHQGTAPARRWATFALAASTVLAVGIALVMGLGESTPESALAMRGTSVGLELGVGETRCGPGLPGEMKPCAWSSGKEALTLHVRVEPHAKARHLVVMARDSTGDVTVLYPEGGKADVPLAETRSRASDTCRDALCWLEGGHYEVPPGQLSVVALFAERPLDAQAFTGAWAPENWSEAVQLVERFELEVVH